mmetsp:Transcript_33900/g.85802  ORF Transcript_33900/g.85802 Transcript_33900/m.85802 type:complete len:331 (-) Transcript_33900:826-1818(-)
MTLRDLRATRLPALRPLLLAPSSLTIVLRCPSASQSTPSPSSSSAAPPCDSSSSASLASSSALSSSSSSATSSCCSASSPVSPCSCCCCPRFWRRLAGSSMAFMALPMAPLPSALPMAPCAAPSTCTTCSSVAASRAAATASPRSAPAVAAAAAALALAALPAAADAVLSTPLIEPPSIISTVPTASCTMRAACCSSACCVPARTFLGRLPEPAMVSLAASRESAMSYFIAPDTWLVAAVLLFASTSDASAPSAARTAMLTPRTASPNCLVSLPTCAACGLSHMPRLWHRMSPCARYCSMAVNSTGAYWSTYAPHVPASGGPSASHSPLV